MIAADQPRDRRGRWAQYRQAGSDLGPFSLPLTPTEEEFAAQGERFGVSRDQIEHDFVISRVLYALQPHAERFVFYGGTALSRTFLNGSRLSEDIDLLSIGPRQQVAGDLDRAIRTGLERDFGGEDARKGSGAVCRGRDRGERVVLRVGRDQRREIRAQGEREFDGADEYAHDAVDGENALRRLQPGASLDHDPHLGARVLRCRRRVAPQPREQAPAAVPARRIVRGANRRLRLLDGLDHGDDHDIGPDIERPADRGVGELCDAHGDRRTTRKRVERPDCRYDSGVVESPVLRVEADPVEPRLCNLHGCQRLPEHAPRAAGLTALDDCRGFHVAILRRPRAHVPDPGGYVGPMMIMKSDCGGPDAGGGYFAPYSCRRGLW